MEDLESTSLESTSSPSSSTEKTREQSEKQRESYKKAQAQIQRSQKDEKKAQGDNQKLFEVFERFIQNPYYEELVPRVTDLLARSIPSRYILSMIALFYPEAAIHLLTAIGKQKDIEVLLSIHRSPEMCDFNEASLHPTIRNWMSLYVQSTQTYITQSDMSLILQDKLIGLLSDTSSSVRDALAEGLMFFFFSRNIRPHKRTMTLYADHIIREHIAALQKGIDLSPDRELLAPTHTEDLIFFGLSQDGSAPPATSR